MAALIKSERPGLVASTPVAAGVSGAMLLIFVVTFIFPSVLAVLFFSIDRVANPLLWYAFVTYAFVNGNFLHWFVASAHLLVSGRVVEAYITRAACLAILISSAVLGAFALLLAGVQDSVIGSSSMVSGYAVAAICCWVAKRRQMAGWVKYWILYLTLGYILALLGGSPLSIALLLGGVPPGLYAIALLRPRSTRPGLPMIESAP